jgi:calcineurin-like phosphoesterase family protein
MSTFLTADPHFGHENIIRYCNRPFAHVAEMNRSLIERWNSRVHKRDTVKVLGDFCCHLSDKDALEIFNALNGSKELIIGNHDLDRKGKVIQSVARLPWAKPPTHYGEIKHDGHRIVLSHYAALTWNGSHHGSFMAFGHSHATLPSLPGSIDVGVDAQNFYPISVEEFVKQAKQSIIEAPARIAKVKEMLDMLEPRIAERASKLINPEIDCNKD